MRSSTWISILVGLFIFQSFWNVAAAFCVHENNTNAVQNYHFGHHQNNLCISGNLQHQTSNLSSDHQISHSDATQDDHQDHLPSMTHVILQQQKIMIQQNHLFASDDPIFYWKNNYQPPDLLSASPPPELSPLMVG